MSRPEKIIDWDVVDELLMAGCPGTDIAAYFGMHPDTFYKRVMAEYDMGFSEYLQQKRSSGDCLLRKSQFDKALDKDTSMLIWLGKQRLGQKENHDISIDSTTVKEFAGAMGWIKEMQDKKKNSESSELSNVTEIS
jgi:hypothetical protein